MMHRPFNFNKLALRVRRDSGSESDTEPRLFPSNNWLSPDTIIMRPRLNSAVSCGSGGTGGGRSLRSRTFLASSGGRRQSLALLFSTSPVNNSQLSTHDLVRNETILVISRKLDSVLHDLGLHNPIPIKASKRQKVGAESKSARFYVANSNNCVYLPPMVSTSSTYEEMENGTTGVEDDSPDLLPEMVVPAAGAAPTELRDKMDSLVLPNYLVGAISPASPIPHTFAVILELKKDTAGFKDLEFEFSSHTQIMWPHGDQFNRYMAAEDFDIGRMKWLPRLEDADYFISASNLVDSRIRHVTPQDLAKRTRQYTLIRDMAESLGSPFDLYTGTSTPPPSASYSSSPSPSFSSLPATPPLPLVTLTGSESSLASSETAAEGIYVFLLPLLLPPQLPAAIETINGYLAHNLSVSFTKSADFMARRVKVAASYSLPIVRQPPSFAELIADKPIFIKRCWSDALHYSVTLDKKFLLLGQDHIATIKLVPMIKDVAVKRIRVNVLERITYFLQKQDQHYEYDLLDVYNLRPPHTEENKKKRRQKVVPLIQLLAKPRQSLSSLDPFRLETISCPQNNLLHACYTKEKAPNELRTAAAAAAAGEEGEGEGMNSNRRSQRIVATPLEIKLSLPFLCTFADKEIANENTHLRPCHYSPAHVHSILSTGVNATRKNSIDLTTCEESHLRLLHHNFKDRTTSTERALVPDSNYRHIQVNHRLQVCFRLSRPDAEDPAKTRHFEVVVDTPVVLVSSKCNEESTQLPQYDRDNDHEVAVEEGEGEEGGHGIHPNFHLNLQLMSSGLLSSLGFSRAGVLIRPFTGFDGEDEHLPSFEEATVLALNPGLNIRPVWRDPAPAYDLDDFASSSDEDDDEEEEEDGENDDDIDYNSVVIMSQHDKPAVLVDAFGHGGESRSVMPSVVSHNNTELYSGMSLRFGSLAIQDENLVPCSNHDAYGRRSEDSVQSLLASDSAENVSHGTGATSPLRSSQSRTNCDEASMDIGDTNI